MTHPVRTCLTHLVEHVSSCLAELVAHLGSSFIFWSGMVTHSWLFGLYEMLAELFLGGGGFLICLA